MNTQPAISVIVPIYGVEHFIKRCAESLFRQTLCEGIEYIFVNDATKDSSLLRLNEVIERFPEKKKNITIVEHEYNKGLPAARNSGLRIAKGKYIYHVDGDDFVDAELFERMFETACREDADYVWSDWYLSYENTERYMQQHYASDVKAAIKLMLTGRNKYNVWNKLVRRSIYEDFNIRFPEKHPMGEDMTMIKLLSCAKRVAYTPGAWYHYIKINPDAMTVRPSDNAVADIIANVNETASFLLHSDIEGIESMINDFKLTTKYNFLFSNKTSDYRLWYNLWPESNNSISKRNGLHALSVQTLARLKLWPLLKVHFFIYNYLYRRIYG